MTTVSLRRTAGSYSAFYAIFFIALLGLHSPVLSLPYFWDELGQFIPAALDIFQLGAWVPKTTLPNVHPPGVMAYLAGVWSIFGYSITATRIAMLSIAALGVLATFLVTIELCRPLPGSPAFVAPALLLASPLFWAQSVMAQLDMPAMTLSCLAIWLFFRKELTLCIACCTALVLAKETGLVVPFAFACFLLRKREFARAAAFVIPVVALVSWLVMLHHATGHWLGNQEFTHYNIAFQLHPVRLPLTFVRRLFYLFVDNLHIAGTLVIIHALRRRRDLFQNENWALILTIVVLHVIVVTVLGGAALERYLMPVIPLYYAAVAAALTTLGRITRLAVVVAMLTGLFAGVLLNSPLAYPFENNAAFVSFVRLQQHAAEYIQTELPGRTVTSAWPFPDALRRPEFGYVSHPIAVRGIENFNSETVFHLADRVDVLVLYSRTWEPKWGALRSDWVVDFLTKYYYYQPQVTSDEIRIVLGMTPVARWEENGQWIEVFTRTQDNRPALVL